MRPLAVVVVPARDEEERIGACMAALAVQAGVAPGDVEILVVLDGCVDGTERAIETAARRHPWLPIGTQHTDGIGPGLARAHGLRLARARQPRLLCTTDADCLVAHDWIATQLEAVTRGAGAVGGQVQLDALEAAELDPGVLAARATHARSRVNTVRRWAPEAEHGVFCGASIALTPAAYDVVGGLPELAVREDEALERALRDQGVRLAYPRVVRVTTSARPGGRMTRVPEPLARFERRAARAEEPAPAW